MDENLLDGVEFTDEQLRAFITKAHRLGKKVDVHCGGNNDGLRRMLAFDVDTLEHPFYGAQLIPTEPAGPSPFVHAVSRRSPVAPAVPDRRACDP